MSSATWAGITWIGSPTANHRNTSQRPVFRRVAMPRWWTTSFRMRLTSAIAASAKSFLSTPSAAAMRAR